MVKELFESALKESTSDEYLKTCEWIQSNLSPRETILNNAWSSYGLKHAMEHDIGLYVTNNVFKMAMIEAGYNYKKECNCHDIEDSSCNLHFNISKKSPGLKRLYPHGVLIHENCKNYKV